MPPRTGPDVPGPRPLSARLCPRQQPGKEPGTVSSADSLPGPQRLSGTVGGGGCHQCRQPPPLPIQVRPWGPQAPAAKHAAGLGGGLASICRRPSTELPQPWHFCLTVGRWADGRASGRSGRDNTRGARPLAHTAGAGHRLLAAPAPAIQPVEPIRLFGSTSKHGRSAVLSLPPAAASPRCLAEVESARAGEMGRASS